MGGFEWWMKDTNKIYSLNLDNQQAGWKLFGRMPEPNNHFGVAVHDGWVYVMAGQTGNDATAKFKNSAWRWQPGTNNWQRLPNLAGVARSHIWSSTIVFQNRIWVLGGETDTNSPGRPRSVPAVDVYDPVTNTWSKNTDLPSGRSTGSAAVWGDKIIFSSGMLSGVFKSDTWIGTLV
jgi:N-acetylneuraminic acid mutarotase